MQEKERKSWWCLTYKVGAIKQLASGTTSECRIIYTHRFITVPQQMSSTNTHHVLNINNVELHLVDIKPTFTLQTNCTTCLL